MDIDSVDSGSVASPSTSTMPSLAGAGQRKRKALPTHRCRFPDWTPSAIAALTITPTSFDAALLGFGGSSAERGVVGVGRANGDVELMLWGGHQGWVSWRTLPSSFPLPQHRNSKKPTSLLSHLVFTHQTTLSDSDLELYHGDVPGAEQEVRRLQREGVRLFGVGGVGSELVEWEWGGPGSTKEVGRVKSTLPTLPPIFALAASRSSSALAVGCEDSTIRILNIMDDELELVSKIEVGGPGKVRALSLAWGPLTTPKPPTKGKGREDTPESTLPAHFATPRDTYLVAGCSNSSIRRFDVPSSGSVIGVWRGVHRLTVDQLKGEHTVVWAVAVLKDGTIVSGDSMGNVKFWDGEMGTQSQSFKSHKADVLCLAVGSDGTSVFTSGVDQKTSEFRLVTVSSSRAHGVPTGRWIQASGRRLHSHDVRAMIMSPPYALPLPTPSPLAPTAAPQVPILTSGGLDLNLIIVATSPAPTHSLSSARSQPKLKNPVSDVPSTEFETTIHRRAAYVPQRSKPFAVSGEARLLVCRRERSVGIWRLEDPRSFKQESKSKSGWQSRREAFGVKDVDEEEVVEETTGWSKAVDMELKLQTNLIASAVSSDGRWLAVSDLYETKLFRLQMKNGELTPRRQKTFSTHLSDALPTSLGTGSSSLLFTRDSRRLILATSFGSSIAVVELPTGRDEDFEVVKVFGEHGERDGGRELRGKVANGKTNGDVDGDVAMNGVNGKHDDSEDSDEDDDDDESDDGVSGSLANKPATVTCLAVSSDGKWLGSADLERKVCVFDLEDLKHHTTLPTPAHVPSALSFLPTSTTSEPTLLVALPTNAITLFGLDSLRFHPWALPLSSLHSNTLMDIREPVLGVTFEPRDDSAVAKVHESRRATLWNDQIAVVWGANWVAKIDLEQVRNGGSGSGEGVSKKQPVRRDADRKRARDDEEEDEILRKAVEGAPQLDIRTTRRYQPLVLFDFVGQGELVAVERTWFDLSRGLVDAFVKAGEFGS